MEKKRKLTSNSADSLQKKQQTQHAENQERDDEQQLLPEGVITEEVEEDGEEENEGEEETNASTGVQDEDDDEEPIQKLLEPFSKEQLVGLLSAAAETHPDVAAIVKMAANQDTVHRKIFVHGLGWDATADTLINAFSQFGEIEDCKAVTDKISGKSKGYGFILFKSRAGARRALQQPQKKIGNRMTACQLAAVGPVPSITSSSQSTFQQPISEYTQRKIYVSNVSADLDPVKLTAFFSKFGEIEEGPLGLDKQTGKPKGFCLFVYKSIESAKKALEEPHKQYEGHVLHCQKAIDGPKPGKQQQYQGRGQQQYGRNDNPNLAGAIGGPPATGAGLMGQSAGGVQFNQGAAAAPVPALNPALGQALTALLTSQGAGLGLNNLLGTLGSSIGSAVVPSGHGISGGYAVGGINPSTVLGGYGTQGGLQAAYPNQQMSQGGSGRPQHGQMGGVAPYGGH